MKNKVVPLTHPPRPQDWLLGMHPTAGHLPVCKYDGDTMDRRTLFRDSSIATASAAFSLAAWPAVAFGTGVVGLATTVLGIDAVQEECS